MIPKVLAQSSRKVLVLDSRDCFAIDSMQIDSKHFRSNTSLAFELEQYLPLDAERMAIGVVNGSTKGISKARGEGMIVVVDRDPLLSTVTKMETEGVWIAGISPRILLASQIWCLENKIQICHLLWQDTESDSWDYLRIQAGCVTRWLWTNCETALQEASQSLTSTDEPIHILGIVPDDLQNVVSDLGARAKYHLGGNVDELLDRGERLCCDGRLMPWVDLRGSDLKTRYQHAPLYPGLLTLTASLLLFFGVCAVLLAWRTHRLSESIRDNDRVIEALFDRTFPGQRVPPDIAGRLTSELRKLELARIEMSKEPPVYSSYPTVVHFINQLPQDAVFRVDAIRAKSLQITSVEGATSSLSEFEKLVGAIRAGGYQFAPPNVGKMKDGFSIRLERLIYQGLSKEKKVTSTP